jgi:hypothetical protein
LEGEDAESVDIFLEQHFSNKAWVNIGKTAIALSLLRSERPNQLFGNMRAKRLSCCRSGGTSKDYPKHWYRLLRKALTDNASRDTFYCNSLRLKVITFNYDRSLEYYLNKSLSPFYNPNIRGAGPLWPIPIIHVHGSLGLLTNRCGQAATSGEDKTNAKQNSSLPSLSPIKYGGHERLFDRINQKRSTKKDRELIANVANAIQIVPETNSESHEFTWARTELCGAHRIFFLGFGYHEANMHKLKLEEIGAPPKRDKREVRGTAVGLDKTTTSRLARLNQPSFKRNHIMLHDGDIYNFLQNEVDLTAE